MHAYETDRDFGDESRYADLPGVDQPQCTDHAIYLNGTPYELGGSPVVLDQEMAMRFVVSRNGSPYYRGMGVWSCGKVS